MKSVFAVHQASQPIDRVRELYISEAKAHARAEWLNVNANTRSGHDGYYYVEEWDLEDAGESK